MKSNDDPFLHGGMVSRSSRAGKARLQGRAISTGSLDSPPIWNGVEMCTAGTIGSL
ncbi:MAG: hypothetical protein IPM54_10710 [Polyangiaceae bacterium]|nr:hypothetical protein [Polyangiaceae bacterium]